ncbi:MAG: hypothetical protein VYC30_05065 [Pseudomonadota bacterium]|nr:hypothetical protein [Pseudomonadota bacterium]
MKKFFKWISIIIGTLVIALGLFLLSMRFSDGPREIFSGGPFTSGELTEAPENWSFLTDRGTIDFQTMDPDTSRTVWLAVHDRRLFLVSGYMNTGYGGIWKQWPHYLENDDRVILRIDGQLYEQRLQRITEGPEIVPVLDELARKYFPGATGSGISSPVSVTNGDTWMYEVVDR